MRKATILLTLVFTLIFAQYAFADAVTDEELFYAVSSGNIEQVTIALANGGDPNVGNPETGFSALMASCLLSDHTIAELLLATGADVNKRTKSGKSALYYAVEKDDLNLARLLIEYGAYANISTTEGITLRQVARRNKNPDMMLLLDNELNKATLEAYQEVPYRTSLLILDEVKIFHARQEAKIFPPTDNVDKLLYYPLNTTFQSMRSSRQSPSPKVALITPYSLLRYHYEVERSSRKLAPEKIHIIDKNKDIVWLWVKAGNKHPYIDNVVIRINNKTYPPLAKELYNIAPLAEGQIASAEVWAFPIKLFTKRNPLTEITVCYPDGKEYIVRIKAEDFAQTPLK